MHSMTERGITLDWAGWQAAGCPLPGVAAHEAVMPFGRTSAAEARNQGQPGQDFREAAVLIGLEPDGRFAMIQRTLGGGVHGGQMALPGGRREAGESMQGCALREWREELGLDSDVEPLASPQAMTEVHVVPSRFVVRPFLVPVQLPETLRPDPLEVAEVHRVDLGQLMNPASIHTQKVGAGGDATWKLEAPGFALPGVPFIWGATAMMLAELAALGVRWSHPSAG